MTRYSIRLGFLFATLAMLPALGSCSDDPADEGDPAEAVVAMRLTVGAQIITINDGNVTGGPIVIPIGNTPITAVFLDVSNGVVSGLDAEFRLEVASDNSNIATFSRTTAFAGNLAGVAAGQTTLSFSLFHVEENHSDFGPFPVQTTVQ